MNTVERNQAIGLVLISAMLIAYFSFFSNTPTPSESTPSSKDVAASVSDSAIAANGSNVQEDLAAKYGDFSALATGTEKVFTLENENLKVTLSNKGAAIQSVTLKDYETYSHTPLMLWNSDFATLNQQFVTNQGVVNSSDLFYSATLYEDTLVFDLQNGNTKYSSIKYYLKPKSFELLCQLKIHELGRMLADKNITFTLQAQLPNTEKDLTVARQTANITYRLADGTYSSLTETKLEPQEADLESSVHWVNFKQKFFSIGLIADKSFSKGKIASNVNVNNPNVVKSLSAELVLNTNQLSNEGFGYKFYFGPNKLSYVKNVADNFNENVYLGWPVINTINRYTIAPLFAFLERFTSNYGLIILLMVLIIKAILFPLSFQSYKSMAKIKVLKPELDEIKARVGDDMGALQQEQMKLYQQVGVNPLSGCIPVLLQMPVLLAMFNFFPNAIELRQQPFLWADDLSTYDSILNLPFALPFYGDHVSLFTLLMTASTILYTWYNNQIQVSATGPMVAMSYIMPLIFMFVLNSMPAGLTFYYFVSNMVTIGQQFIIKAFVDEKAIRAKLEENKKNQGNRKPNRFQQRLMAAMEQQQELKKKSTKK